MSRPPSDSPTKTVYSSQSSTGTSTTTEVQKIAFDNIGYDPGKLIGKRLRWLIRRATGTETGCNLATNSYKQELEGPTPEGEPRFVGNRTVQNALKYWRFEVIDEALGGKRTNVYLLPLHAYDARVQMIEEEGLIRRGNESLEYAFDPELQTYLSSTPHDLRRPNGIKVEDAAVGHLATVRSTASQASGDRLNTTRVIGLRLEGM